MSLFKTLRNRWWMHTHTPEEYSRRIGVNAGEDFHVYGGVVWSTEPWIITMGDHVHITDGVRFETHDGGTLLFRREIPDLEVTRPIVLGDNVYVGNCAIIMGGGNYRQQRGHRRGGNRDPRYPQQFGCRRRASEGHRDNRRVFREAQGEVSSSGASHLGGEGPSPEEALRLHGHIARNLRV